MSARAHTHTHTPFYEIASKHNESSVEFVLCTVGTLVELAMGDVFLLFNVFALSF